MTRVLASTSAEVRLRVQPGGQLSHLHAKLDPEAEAICVRAAAREIERLVKVHVVPETSELDGVLVHIVEDFKCSGCGHKWTESDAVYNGGCCEIDEQNNPQVSKAGAAP